MKEEELRMHSTCFKCKKKVLEGGHISFWRVAVERFVVDVGAIQRQQGLTMMLGGSAKLALAMGPDEDVAKPLMDATTVTLCEACGSGSLVNICDLADTSDRS